LATSGKRVCILTRGYGRENPKTRVLVSDGTKVYSNPTDAGDEPYLLAKNLEGVAAVISDANRLSAGQGAIKHLGSDCFVLDDGFQHMQLARNLNIVTLDATNPWGGGRMLPIGTLREPLDGLKRADCIVLTRCDQTEHLKEIESKVFQLIGNKLIFRSKMITKQIVPLNASDPNSELQNPVAAFCAIGNPVSFVTHLQRDGYDLVVQKFFQDHHRYTQNDVDELVLLAKQAGARGLITTTKDAVKLQALNLQLPFYSLHIEVEIDNADELRRLVLNAAN
jgi:tetraacyldisaccharide 4'-kinase